MSKDAKELAKIMAHLILEIPLEKVKEAYNTETINPK